MTRFVVMLAALLLLVLSAGLTPTWLNSTARDGSAGQTLLRGSMLAADSALTIASAPEHTRAPKLIVTASDDRPPPALLAYLGLVVVGSVVAVALVRRGASREL